MRGTHKRVFLITGPEATGTKLVTRILLAAGCHGDAGNDQWIERAMHDNLTFECSPIVLRLSMPCGLVWHKIDDVLWHLKSLGYYEMRVIVTSRCWYATGRSQTKNGTHAVSLQHSENKRRRAYEEIYSSLKFFDEVPHCLVTYEALLMRPQSVMEWLLDWCGLPMPEADKLPTVRDENGKWYQEK